MIFKNTPNKMNIKGMYFNVIKLYVTTPQLTSYLTVKSWKFFLLKITNKTSRSTFTIIQYSTKSPSKSQLGKKKEIKGIQTGQEELKLFADDMTLHATTKKLKIKLPYYPAIPPLDIYPKEMRTRIS